ncbi:hypothetical protein ACFOEE_00390 [Pseudoalteromonas fenneropenaei]|uniref:Lipoprotein n=1 Tax=Pseudoalteromonas fenneropenaei TaxID=1737459 RepID=A0ABV7CC72_9GAMM
MKQLSYLPTIAAFTLTLAACGGGSSNSTTPDITQPETIEEKSISLTTYTHTLCDEQPYQADIVFHDGAGKPIKITKTNTDGTFSSVIPKDAKHLSILGVAQENEIDTPMRKISTELNIEQGGELGRYYFARPTTSSCSCQELQLNVSELTYLNEGYVLNFENSRVIPNSSSLARICTSANTLYFSVTSPDKSEVKAAELTIADNTQFLSLTNEDFKHPGIAIEDQYSPTADKLMLLGFKDGTSTKQLPTQVKNVTSQTPFYIFPSLTEYNFQYQRAYAESHFDNISIYVTHSARSRINANGDYELTALPQSNTQLGRELLDFSQNINSNYDFSLVDNRYSEVRMNFDFTRNGQAEFSWSIFGGIKASVPDLSFGSVFPEPSDDIELRRLALNLSGYEGAPRDFNAYRAFLNKRHSDKFLKHPEYAKYVYTSITATVD